MAENATNNKIVLMDQQSGKSLTLLPTSFSDLGVKERQDLEEWIKDNPDILGEKLLIVTSEYDHFENSDKRLDLLALDGQGKLVVIELKRDVAGTLADLQAIRYAAFCSTMLFDQVVSLRAKFANMSDEDARQDIQEFVGKPEFSTLDNKPRIILAAGGFNDPEVTSCVLWLRDFGVDISCAEITPYRMPDSQIVLVPRVIIPLPAAREYMVRAEKKESDEGGEKKKFTAEELRTIADNRQVRSLVEICRRLVEIWEEKTSSNGSFIYWLTTDGGWRLLCRVFVSAEEMDTPLGQLDVQVFTKRLAEVTGQDEAAIRNTLADRHPQRAAHVKYCIIRLSTPAQAEALVMQLKEWWNLRPEPSISEPLERASERATGN
jgi:hypothetical protein